MTKDAPHQPVLLQEVVELLNPQKGESYLDLTAGYGGHAAEIFEHTQAPKSSVLVDRDRDAVDYLANKFSGKKPKIIHSDYLTASQGLIDQAKVFDLILADLGVSSLQFDNSRRGFSLRHDGPLDMRMDQTQTLTAKDIVNNYSKEQLIHIFRQYGEEPQAYKIASAIVKNRPLNSTIELANLVPKTESVGAKIISRCFID